MPRFRAIFALCLLVLFTALLAPRPSAGANFTPMWSLAGWNLRGDLGNLDSDPQPELMFSSKLDDHFAIVDGKTGVIEREFPQFAYSTSGYDVTDLDGDGKPELLFTRSGGGTPLNTGYHWNGSAYVSVFSNTDPVQTWGPVHLRSATTFDILENLPNDIIVRDLSGNILYRASTAIAGWVGASAFAYLTDLDHDGIQEMLVMDIPNKAWMFKYNGAFTQLWSRPDWFVQADLNLDSDPQPEFIAFNTNDYHYGLIDGLTGVVQNDFFAYTLLQGSQLVPTDLDNDGHPELILLRPYTPSQSTLCHALRWNATKFDTLYKHTLPTGAVYVTHLRSGAQTEVVEVTNDAGAHDIRLRDPSGAVLFTASTGIPGWSNSEPTEVINSFTGSNGVLQSLIQDGSTVRAVHYSGAFSQTWAASGWQFVGDAGNTDSAPGVELMLNNLTDGRYGLFDVASGVEKKDFPNFTTPAGVFTAGDADGDGRNELYFARVNSFGQPPLSTAYKWNGSSYATVYSHADTIQGISLEHLRAPSLTEALETTFTDFRLRDPLTGSRLFTASTDLPGFTRLDMNATVVLTQADLDGNGTNDILISDLNAVRAVHYAGTTAVPPASNPMAFAILPNSPNPFRTSTAIRFALPHDAHVRVRIFDAAGRLVRNLDGNFAAGRQELQWDGRDTLGHDAPNGVLFLSITANGAMRTGKIVRMQ